MCRIRNIILGSIISGFALLAGPSHLLADSAQTGKIAVSARESDSTDLKEQILTRLPNGLLVYIIRDDRFPLACTRLYVHAGSANEKPSQAGISHLLEHMVFKGTSHRPKGQVARDVEALGGYLNAATSFDRTWYLTDMPAQHWQVGMDVVRDMAFQATLDPEELEAEKNVVISELQRGEDSPMRKLYENLQVAALKNTPYGRPIIGYERTIKAITAADLRAYVKQWYQPQNMMLLVAGNIDPDKVLKHAQELFGDLKNHSDLSVPEPVSLSDAATGDAQVLVESGAWNKVYIGLALPVPGLKDLRSVELDVLSYLLGGDGTSAFYKKYKYERQLVDSISVGNMSLARAGLFTVIASLPQEKVEEFWKELTTDLATLNAGAFSAEAIQRAIFNLEDSMERAGETLNGLASWKGTVQFELGGEQSEKNIRFAQKNVNGQQLQNAIDNWLDPGRARVRILCPENARLPDFAAILKNNWPAALKTADSSEMESAAQGRETISLGNGCSLILIPDDNAPYVAIDLLMAGGNFMLLPKQQGLADLTARLLTDGAGELNSPAMEKWFAQRAASVSARAGLQTFGISINGPSRFNDDYFQILRDILLKPKFEPQELQREIENMKAAIRQRNDQPLSYMFSKINPFLFPHEQPYGYDSLGSVENLDRFNAVSVRDYWTLQSGQPWTLAIAGNFKRDDVIAFAKTLPPPRLKKFEFTQPRWGDSKDMALTLPGKNQAHLMLIFKTVPPTHEDAPALMLLQSMLSGQSGLLFTRLRDEQGLGYTVTAFNRSMPQTGFMVFYIGTTPDKIEQSQAGFEEVIRQIQEKQLPAELLAAGANSLLGDYLRERQSLNSRASEAATDAVLSYPENFEKILVDKAAKLKPDDILRVAQKYLVNPYKVTLLP